MANGAGLFLAHLPQIELESTDVEFHINYGTLVQLDFDNWAMYEGHGARDWQSYFGQKHTFFTRNMEADEVMPAELLQRPPASYLASGSHFAWYLLWFSTGVFTLHPELAASYVVFIENSDKQQVLKKKGYCDNDLFRQEPIVTIRAKDAPALFENSRKLHLNAQHNFILDQLLAPYRRMVSSNADPQVVFSFVSLLEQILNPEGLSPLGRTFAARFAVLMASEDLGSLDQWVEFGRRLYDLRSRVIHGSGVSRSMDRLFADVEHRTFLPVNVLKMLACSFASLEAMKLSSEDLPKLASSTQLEPAVSDVMRFREKLQIQKLELIGRCGDE